MNNEWTISEFKPDLECYIRLKPYTHDKKCYVVLFEVFNIHEDYSETKMKWMFDKKDTSYYANPIDDPDKAEIMISGSVKWDGCSDINYGRNGYIHSCSRNQVTRLSKILDYVFESAAKIMVDSGQIMIDFEYVYDNQTLNESK